MSRNTARNTARKTVRSSIPPVTPDMDTETLVRTHLPLIQTIAKRLTKRLPPSVDLDELINIGVLGLMDAWERFDASKGVPFKAYAEMRIKGQIIDALRADDIVPRSVRRKHNRLEQERQQLRARLGRAPTHGELRTQLDMAPKAFDAYMRDSRIAKVTSLDVSVTEDGTTPLVESLSNHEDTAEDTLSLKEMSKAVAEAVQHLPPKECTAITLYYLDRLTLKEIGQRLGVTESRACQLRGQGVKRLRYRLRHLAS